MGTPRRNLSQIQDPLIIESFTARGKSLITGSQRKRIFNDFMWVLLLYNITAYIIAGIKAWHKAWWTLPGNLF